MRGCCHRYEVLHQRGLTVTDCGLLHHNSTRVQGLIYPIMAAITDSSVFNSLFNMREETKLQTGWIMRLNSWWVVYVRRHHIAGDGRWSCSERLRVPKHKHKTRHRTALRLARTNQRINYSHIHLCKAAYALTSVTLPCWWSAAVTWDGDPSLRHSDSSFKGLHLSPRAVCISHISFCGKALWRFFQSPVNHTMLLRLSREPSRPNNSGIIYEINRPLPSDSLWQNYVETHIFLPEGRI